jgi:hypothetical protein
MIKKNSLIPLKKLLNHLFDFLRSTEKRAWDYLVLGSAIFLVIVFIIYGSKTLSSMNSEIQYSPADVVYGESIYAIHNVNIMNTPQNIGLISNEATDKPQILISEKFYDFGVVNSNQILKRTFIFANSGNSPLMIHRAYTTCGCTTAIFTANEIPPGKVVLMTLQFDTGYHDMQGKTVRRGVILETNDPDHPVQEIWIQAKVR